MKNDKVWDKIDASPLLQLPPEERERLKETKDVHSSFIFKFIGYCNG